MTPGRCDPIRKDLIPGPEHIDHFLRSRRSIRSYRDKPLDRETLLSLIRTAAYAPSGHNLQPVHWLVVEDRDEVKRLAGIVIEWMGFMIENQPEIAGSMHFDRVVAAWENGLDRVLRDAPHLIVAHGRADLPAAQTACVVALTYLELAAYSRGLGACWAGYFNGAATFYRPMQEALALPVGHQSFGAMMLGQAKYKYRRIPLRNEPQIEWR